LLKVASQLDQERKEQKNLQHLHEQIEESQAVLRERLLLKIIMGAVSSTEAIEEGQHLGLDLIARCYLVAILKIGLKDRSESFDYEEYEQVQRIVTGLVESIPDVFVLRKDWEELVLLMKGNAPEFVQEERERLLGQIQHEIGETRYRLTIGVGSLKHRLAELHQSFVEGLVNI
jgi:sugar diacid utilization regulator